MLEQVVSCSNTPVSEIAPKLNPPTPRIPRQPHPVAKIGEANRVAQPKPIPTGQQAHPPPIPRGSKRQGAVRDKRQNGISKQHTKNEQGKHVKQETNISSGTTRGAEIQQGIW